jgi:hypothetical protein
MDQVVSRRQLDATATRSPAVVHIKIPRQKRAQIRELYCIDQRWTLCSSCSVRRSNATRPFLAAFYSVRRSIWRADVSSSTTKTGREGSSPR